MVLGLVLGMALTLPVGCGGGSSTPAPVPIPVAAPTITGFSPASGVIGASVTLTGTALTGTTAVAFGSRAAASYSVLSDAQVRAVVPAGAVSAPLTIATASGSATSAASFTILPSPTPALTAFSPDTGPVGTGVTLTGTGFLGASAVTFDGVATPFTVASDTRIVTSVPAGAGTGPITVTTPGGTATSAATFLVTAAATLDLSIDGLSLTQASQTYPATVPLVANRTAWVRVFVKANQANVAQPQVRVVFSNGATTWTLTITAPTASVPTTINEGDATQSWNAAVPAAWIQPGLTVLATVDPTGTIPEVDKSNNQYPVNATPQALAVDALSVWKVRLLPVTTGDGRTGAVDATTVSAYVDMARRVHPMPDALDAALGTGLTSSVTTLTNEDAHWSTVLEEVTAKWTADGRPATYFGVVNPDYTSGVAGMGWVGQAVAIGWDKVSTRARVLAHEVGHTFGRLHAPCSVTDPDSGYPTTGDYAGGHIGVTGWDVFATSGNLKLPALYTDVMGYCSTQWVSDYPYNGVFAYQKAHPQILVPPAATEGLLVWGHLEDDRLVLQPAIRVKAPAVAPEPGPYHWEARDAAGSVRLAVAFQPTVVADAPRGGLKLFSFVVSLGDVPEGDLQRLQVVREGREVASAVRLAPLPLRAGAPPEEAVQVTDERERVDLVWDAGKYPLLVVRDAATGEILGFQRGGAGRVRTERRDLEILACDGVQTRVQRFRRAP